MDGRHKIARRTKVDVTVETSDGFDAVAHAFPLLFLNIILIRWLGIRQFRTDTIEGLLLLG